MVSTSLTGATDLQLLAECRGVERFDLAVIGCGPAGQKAAIQGAKAGKRVVVVEREARVGGACVERGTIPSKTLREAALQVSMVRQVLGDTALRLDPGFAIGQLLTRLQAVLDQHQNFWTDQLVRNGIHMETGSARFADETTLEISHLDDKTTIRFESAIVATGSSPRRPDNMTIDGVHIHDSDTILTIDTLPKSMLVLGGGVIASEYASVFASLGVDVTMIDSRSRPVSFVEPELSQRFVSAFADAGGKYIPDQKVTSLTLIDDEVRAQTAAGESLRAQTALVALGRNANSVGLGLESIGVSLSKYGTIEVDNRGYTGVGGIYAVGDVVGPPSLASTAMEQGRRAVRAALHLPIPNAPEILPCGVYTIPEIACIGLTEADAINQFGEVVVGRAQYSEVARGCISGDRDGFVKLIAEPENLRVVGVHIIGTSAAELLHIGQMAILAGWSAENFVDNIFNFPTFAEAYRIAAFDIVKQAQRVDINLATG